MSTAEPITYKVTFKNAINHSYKERTTTDLDQARHWARTYWPYNNTRTTISYVADEFAQRTWTRDGYKTTFLRALREVPVDPAEDVPDPRVDALPAVTVTCKLTGRVREGRLEEQFERYSLIFWPHIGSCTRVDNAEVEPLTPLRRHAAPISADDLEDEAFADKLLALARRIADETGLPRTVWPSRHYGERYLDTDCLLTFVAASSWNLHQPPPDAAADAEPLLTVLPADYFTRRDMRQPLGLV